MLSLFACVLALFACVLALSTGPVFVVKLVFLLSFLFRSVMCCFFAILVPDLVVD
jgi:hypothetical protein